MPRKLTRREALAAIGATVLAACFSDRPGSTDPGGGTVVEMTEQLTFSPATVTISVGESVTWKNVSDGIPHTATCDASKAADPANIQLPAGADPWDSGSMSPGDEFTHTFDVPGRYDYVCLPHETLDMLGTVIVNS